MQFFYGSYYHDLNSVAFTGVTNSFIRSQNGRPHLIRKSWSCKGKIVRWSQAEIFNQLTQLQLAYSINGARGKPEDFHPPARGTESGRDQYSGFRLWHPPRKITPHLRTLFHDEDSRSARARGNRSRLITGP